MAIPKDELGIDIMITGSQKALALPPGLSLVSVSKRALERAAERPTAAIISTSLSSRRTTRTA
jgi:aspartate aminotransferase-like enzyme